MKLFRLLGVILMVCAPLGCDNDSDSSAGVSSSKKLKDLTKEEAISLCKEMESYMGQEPTQKEYCEADAAVETAMMQEDKAYCESYYEQCMDLPASEFEDETQDCEDAEVSDLKGCEATVGEFRDCARAGEKESSVQPKYNCDNFGTIDLGGSSNSTPPQACLDFMAKCPQLFYE